MPGQASAGSRSAAVTSTGIPLRTALPRRRVDVDGREQVRVDAGVLGGDRHPVAGGVVAPAVRDRDDAGHDLVGDLDRDDELAASSS